MKVVLTTPDIPSQYLEITEEQLNFFEYLKYELTYDYLADVSIEKLEDIEFKKI